MTTPNPTPDTTNPLAIVDKIMDAAHKIRELEQLAIIYGCATHDHWDRLAAFGLNTHPAALRLQNSLDNWMANRPEQPTPHLVHQFFSDWWNIELTRLLTHEEPTT